MTRASVVGCTLAAATLTLAARSEQDPPRNPRAGHCAGDPTVKAWAVYDQRCVACHGRNLEGGAAGSLIDGAWTFGDDDAHIVETIREGRKGTAMVAFKDALTEEQTMRSPSTARARAGSAWLARACPPCWRGSLERVRANREESMKARAVGYWTCTVLIALSFLSGGAVDVLRAPQALEGMTHLGYPPYFMTILGIWKLLGGGAVLLPRFPLLKEWAYAGMIFDLTGASASHVAVGDDLRHIVVPLVLTALVTASWALRPDRRTLRRA